MTTHAKDYLREYAHQKPDWLKALVHHAMLTNGKIKEQDLEKVYQALAHGSSIDIPSLPDDPAISEKTDRILLDILHHKSGVGALIPNQKIKFSEHVTILYGRNGAGKSSYFKILNEITGGNKKKEIRTNIYEESPKPPSVTINYLKNQKPQPPIQWDGQTRAVPPLSRALVFDSSYTSGLLSTREADTTVIEPLGLHLFGYIVQQIDFLKDRLNTESNSLKANKPALKLEHFQPESREAFEQQQVRDEVKQRIRALYTYTEEQEQRLEAVDKELKIANEQNIQLEIQKISNQLSSLTEGITQLEKYKNQATSFSQEIPSLLEQQAKLQMASTEARKQFEVLQQLPDTNKPTWKSFIQAGEQHSKEASNSDNTHCLYCHQPLQSQALEIVKAYGQYLQDDSEALLREQEEKIKDCTDRIKSFSPSLGKTIKEKSPSFDSALRGLDQYKTLLLEYISSGNVSQSIPFLEITRELEELNRQKQELKASIQQLQHQDKEQKQRLERLLTEKKSLLAHKSISEQKDDIENWLQKDEEARKLIDLQKSCNTRKLTQLSANAHDELLTNQLRTVFGEELNHLGHHHLSVDVVKARGQKGKTSTKLTLIKGTSPQEILSEGEQKAVTLALFLAEARMQPTPNTLIFDDPVTSLDHKIAANFAERLLHLDNQVVIFNHNKLFLDAFEGSKGDNHICKDLDSCSKTNNGKHIKIYSVQSEGKKSKGVLSNYKQNKANTHLKDAKSLCNRNPFQEHIKVSTLIRKAVECCIDEVVFNDITPTRYSNKNSRIAWGNFHKMQTDKTTIKKLESIHGRTSGGLLHNGTEADENPIEVEEYRQMIFDLENILQLKNS